MYAAIRQGKAKPGKAEELTRRIKEGAIPVISEVEPTSEGIALHWADTGRPDAGHVLLTFSSAPPGRYPLTGSPQPLNYGGRPKYCLVVARADDLSQRSAPTCINGAEWKTVVKE